MAKGFVREGSALVRVTETRGKAWQMEVGLDNVDPEPGR